jgi:hypothetical protein
MLTGGVEGNCKGFGASAKTKYFLIKWQRPDFLYL